MSKAISLVLITVAITALVLIAIRGATGTLRAAKRGSRMSAVGWALLFLTSGRMPPPPPASQIEVEIGGKKDRESSRNIGER